MIPFQNKDERLKLIVFILLAFLLQGILVTYTYKISLKEINTKILNQNYEMLGYINSKDSLLADDIVPIITGKSEENAELKKYGKEVLSNYSYDDEVTYDKNPLIKDNERIYVFYLCMILLIIFVIVIFGVIVFLNPLYEEVNHLTFRAENIVENKKINTLNKQTYSGSLDKFIIKFNMMEERIDNSINLLQEEKVNLKNIISDISHQLKTPLMALTMYNDILEDHRNMEVNEVDNFISLSNEQLKRMDWLVKTLLKYARLEGNVVEYNKENYPVNSTIEEVVASLKIKAREKSQVVSFLNNKDINLYHDRKWISEALSNIIKNAIEHTGTGGEIVIGLEETPMIVRIWIKDNGEGIPKEEIKKIFNRFYKGQNSINPTSIGIGLCLSKSIIKSHHGDITVESKENEGSIFYITFLKS